MRDFWGKLFAKSLTLFHSDDGVTTVEWVALAAGLVIGTIGVAYIIMDGLAKAANNVANQLSP